MRKARVPVYPGEHLALRLARHPRHRTPPTSVQRSRLTGATFTSPQLNELRPRPNNVCRHQLSRDSEAVRATVDVANAVVHDRKPFALRTPFPTDEEPGHIAQQLKAVDDHARGASSARGNSRSSRTHTGVAPLVSPCSGQTPPGPPPRSPHRHSATDRIYVRSTTPRKAHPPLRRRRPAYRRDRLQGRAARPRRQDPRSSNSSAEVSPHL